MPTIIDSKTKANTYYVFRDTGEEIEVELINNRIIVHNPLELKHSERLHFENLLKEKRNFNR